jgi:hypothetical protein
MASTFSGVIESFIKPEALKEFDTLGSKIDASLKGFDAVIAKAALLSTEIQKGGAAYSQYIAASTKIADVNKQLQTTQGSVNTNLSAYNKLLTETANTIKDNTGATDDQARRIIALRTELSKTKDAVEVYQKLIREVNKENPASLSDKTFNDVFNAFGSETANNIKTAFDTLDSATKPEFIAQLTADAAQFLEVQKQLEVELKIVAGAFNKQSKEAAAAEGSIAQLETRLDKLQTAYSFLSEADRNSELGVKLKEQIDQLDPQVKELQKNIGITRRLVGDYAGQLSPAFNVLKDRLEEVNNALRGQVQLTGKLKDLTGSSPIGFKSGGAGGGPSSQAIVETVNAVKQLASEQQLLNKLMESGAVATGDLTQSNKELQRTIIGFKQANLEGSESFKAVQGEYIKGKKALNDLRDETKALASDTRALDQVIGVASSLVAVYQTGAAAAQLFGNETEDTQRAIAKLVAVQSVLNGLQTIQQQLTQKGTALNRLYAFAQAQIAIATDASAAATVRFRAALITTGIGALIVAVGFLVNKLIELSNNADEAAKSFENLQERLRQVADETSRLNTFIEQNNQIEVARLKSIGAGEEDVFKAQQDGLKKRLDNLSESRKLVDEERKIFNERNTITKQRTLPGGGNSYETVINETEEYRKGLLEINKRYSELDAQVDQANTQLAVNQFQFTEQQRNKDIANRKKYLDDLKALTEKEARAQLDLFKFRKEQEIKANQDIVANDLFNINERIAARERIAKAQQAIVIAEYNFALKYGQLTQSGLLLQQEQRAAKEKEILTNSLIDQLQLRTDYAKRFKDVDALIDAAFSGVNSADKQITDLVAVYERRKSVIERNTDDELTQLENARAEGIITEDKYRLRREQITTDMARDILLAELELAEKKLAILKKAGVDTIEAEKQIANLRRQLAEAQTKAQQSSDNAKSGNDPIQDQINKVAELRSAYFELGQTLKDTVFTALTRGFEQAKNDIQDQMDLLDERKAKEIEAVNATTASNEDKANRIKIIEATAQAQREELDRRQRKIDVERAKFQRASQIAGIIGNTAQGVTAALTSTPPNVTLAKVVAGIGALELLNLIITPIPKYLHGKKGNYEGLAEVSEDGRPELYIDRKRGIVGLTPAKPSLMHVTAESEIIPHGKIKDFMNYSGIGHVPQLQSSSAAGMQAFTDMNIVNAIKSKKMQQVVVIHNNIGWQQYVQKHVFN